MTGKLPHDREILDTDFECDVGAGEEFGRPLSAAQLESIIGDRITNETRIEVCAGAWVKRDDGLWGFDKDPEWDE
jgi:hypothetical protein